MKKLVVAALAVCATMFAISSAAAECQRVNAAGGVGYVNVRQNPDLNAPIITRWSNPENGSEWGSAFYCGTEYVDYDGRTWSLLEMEFTDGRHIQGWVSDKVLEFLD